MAVHKALREAQSGPSPSAYVDILGTQKAAMQNQTPSPFAERVAEETVKFFNATRG